MSKTSPSLVAVNRRFTIHYTQSNSKALSEKQELRDNHLLRG